MSKIIIGTADRKNVGFDIAELLVTRLLIQANSGGGKSFLLRRILEQAYGKVQAIVIDPAGEFASLREKFGYVLVGEHGETPADIRSAALVAEKLLELRASAVCDLYALKPDNRHIWVQKFLAAVMNAPKRLWHPVLFIVDEAHKFCPEKGEGESEAKSEMLSLASDGRKYGFCAIFATQRLAKLDKSGASELTNVMVGPTFMDIDLERAHRALGIVQADKAAFNEQMRTIPPGHFWALGRAISKTRILVRIGAIQTTHPTAGSGKYSAEPPPAPDKVKLLLPKLADLPKEAEEKARTEAEFKREIRELKSELTVARKLQPAAAISKEDPQAARASARTIRELRTAIEDAMKIITKINAIGFEGVNISTEEMQEALKKAADEIGRIARQKIEQRQRDLERLKTEVSRLVARLEAQIGTADEPISVAVDVVKNDPVTVRVRPALPASASSRPPGEPISGDVTPAQTRILRAAAEFHAVGIPDVSKKWLAARSGASHKSSAYGNNLGALRSRGLLDYRAGQVFLTAAGQELVGPARTSLTVEEMAASCKNLLTPAQRSIFDALYQVYPKGMSRDDLAAAAHASPTSSAFGNNLGAMRSAGMIDYGADKTVEMQKWIFLEVAA